MANTWQYSRGRRIAAQAVTWVILAATVALAVVVSDYRRKSLQVVFDKSQTTKRVSFAPPKGWDVVVSRDDLAPTIFTAQPPDSEFTKLTVLLDPLPQHLSPAQIATAGTKRGRDGVTQEPITIADSPGVLVSYTERLSVRDLPPGLEQYQPRASIIVAATVLPSGRALSVALTGLGEPEASDVDLVRRLVATLKVDGEPALSPASAVKLRGEIATVVPEGFELIDAHDPQSAERVLRAKDLKQLRSISLVPTLLLPKDGPAAIATMLSAYSSSWNEAKVSETSPRQWTAEREDAAASLAIPMRAHVIAGESGASLIAIFSGGADDSWIEPAWKEISPGVTFPPATQIEPLVDRGRQEAARIAATDLATLLPPARDESWWLLFVDAPTRPLGWIHETPGSSAGSGKLERRVHYADHGTEQLVCDFNATPDLKTYRASLDCQFARDARDIQTLPSSPARPLTQEFERFLTITSRLKQGKLDLAAKPGDGVATAVQVTAPQAFVPGPILWQMLGQLSDHPMILRTDVALGCLGTRATFPLTLIIRPDDESPRSADDSPSGKPLRCIAVEIAGSGALTRCYFRSDGMLEGIDYDQGVRQSRRDPSDISPDFARVPAMKP
jgi:hypothetical protein